MVLKRQQVVRQKHRIVVATATRHVNQQTQVVLLDKVPSVDSHLCIEGIAREVGVAHPVCHTQCVLVE